MKGAQIHILMTQMSARAGIEKYLQKGYDAIMKELRELQNRKAI